MPIDATQSYQNATQIEQDRPDSALVHRSAS